MKKATIIICTVIYFLAIVLVAFLGFRAEVENPPIYCDEIVMTYDCPHDVFENGTVIYSIVNNTSYEPDVEKQTEETKFKYDIVIKDFEFIYAVLDGKIQVTAKPISYLKDEEGNALEPSQKELSYSIVNDNVTCDNNGNIQFLTEKTHAVYTMLIKSKDGSNVSIFVRIYW